jgi:hypothetical protein
MVARGRRPVLAGRNKLASPCYMVHPGRAAPISNSCFTAHRKVKTQTKTKGIPSKPLKVGAKTAYDTV